MQDMKLTVSVRMPEPQKEAPGPEKKSIESEVREAIECIESGFDSHKEWLLINKVYKHLVSMQKKSPRVMNLIEMITPVLAKYGYHKVSTEEGE